ncbi:MAG: helix-turn-helix domain-containing protein [Candidatus Hodarchaeales archaeon]
MEEREQKISEILKGKTYDVYWFLLTHNESGIREIQRELKFPSPSTVTYHMNKLIQAGLVKKTRNDKYIVDDIVKNGYLGLYIKIGGRMIPRIVTYISLFASGIFFYAILIIFRYNLRFYVEDVIFFIFMIIAIIIFCYEGYNIWNSKPR